jgi:hypothetical protein
MGGINLYPPPQFSVNPAIARTAAGENEGVHGTAGVDDCEPYVAVVRNVAARIELVPTHTPAWRTKPQVRIDLGQIPAIMSSSRRAVRAAMERFVRRENVKHYKELLKGETEEAERQRILKLLAEEQQKQKDAGDKTED